MTTIEQYLDEHDSRANNSAITPYVEYPKAMGWKAANALRAVTELHRPWEYPDYPDVCRECVDHEGYSLNWPCPTLQVIHDALGVDGKDDTE